MKVYVLDVLGNSRKQMEKLLAEDKRVDTVEIFEDYILFVEKVGEIPPDFCFIRLGENGIPGFKTAELVSQISCHIRIVFVSHDRDYAVDAYEVGAYGYLLYPVDKEKLMKCLWNQKKT